MGTVQALTYCRTLFPAILSAALILPLLFSFGGLASAAAFDGIWRFSFAPANAPAFPSFVNVDAAKDYDSRTGYGWRGAWGGIQSGRWQSAFFTSWEARDRLNLICRAAPDDLARSYFTGPATFVLDLVPGRYEVWILTGDSGFREYLPRADYWILVGKEEAYRFSISADEFYRSIENPGEEDELHPIEVWHRQVVPRFKWVKTIVEVNDEQLNVNVIGSDRDGGVQDYIGDYAITEFRGGPSQRYAGAINAIVVVRSGAADSEAVIREIDSLRLKNFIDRFPLKIKETARQNAEFTERDRKRGYTVFFPEITAPVQPGDRAAHAEKIIRVRATPGEYVPITFGVCPLRDLGVTSVRLSDLKASTSGKEYVLATRDALILGVVRYAARPADATKKGAWQPAPAMIVPSGDWNIRHGVARQFWLSFRVPDQAPPGKYNGRIRVIPELTEETGITVEIEVLPFVLARPHLFSAGMTYFSPVFYAFFGEERFWERVHVEFRDMRAHNLTCVQYTGVSMKDYDRMERALTLYRDTGFENPIYLLESYGIMLRLEREGIHWDNDLFQERYVKFISAFVEEGRRRRWPTIVFNFGDEFTNRGLEEFGAALGRALRQIPGIVTGADANGYREVLLMAPAVDIVAFNNGWDGPKGVNRGIRLLNKTTVAMIRKAGATPWLVNVGIDRFSNGFWLWKMARVGVRGKMEWIYRGWNGMPFDSFDAEPLTGHIVYPGPAGTSIPSLEYEWMRIGLDDMAYLHTLERRIEENRSDPERRFAVASAEAFLEKIATEISDDLQTYLDRQGVIRPPWSADRFDELRAQLIDLLLSFSETSDKGGNPHNLESVLSSD